MNSPSLALALFASLALSSCYYHGYGLVEYEQKRSALDEYRLRKRLQDPKPEFFDLESVTQESFEADLESGDPLAKKVNDEVEERDEELKKLFGTNFGIGPAILLNVDRIKTAAIQGADGDQRVVVTDRNNDEASLLLEFHHLLQPIIAGRRSETIGIGPFAALSLNTTDSIIGGLGLGMMVGMMVRDNVSFNLGYGWMVLNDVERLPGGIGEGEAPPMGVTSVTPVTEDETVNFILASFRWTL